MTAVGFEPTPLRTGASSQRLRPLGQTVLPSGNCVALLVHVLHERFTSVVRTHGDLRRLRAGGRSKQPAGVVEHECAAKPTTSPTPTGATRGLPL